MKGIHVRAVTVAAAFALGFAIPAVLAPGASAGDASRLKADTAACTDYWAWAAKPSAARFHALVTEGAKADTYLRVDVRGLAHSEHIHNLKATELYRGYVAMDCTFTGDQGD